jgi:hypothetical protein
MRNPMTLIMGVVLTVLGVVGFAAVCGLAPASPTGDRGFSSAGQRIYYTGADSQGVLISRTIAGSGITGFGMMADTAACVDCHGDDGRGGRVGMMFGAVEIPDIKYSVLTSPRSQDGTTMPAWTDADIARAIRDGLEPNGQSLKAPMPRWDMTDTQLNDVIAYLKELDKR